MEELAKPGFNTGLGRHSYSHMAHKIPFRFLPIVSTGTQTKHGRGVTG